MKQSTNESPDATLADLAWMCGRWTGALGPQKVEEHWSVACGGTMSTMVRLLGTDPQGDETTIMIELLAIREQANGLILHLRQFSPDLQLVTNQDMPLLSIEPTRGREQVTFAGPADGTIPKLRYAALDPQTMEVQVTTADHTVVAAKLTRD